MPKPPKPHHQYFILRRGLISQSCFPIWKAAVVLPDIFCPVSFNSERKVNIYVYSLSHSTCGRVKKRNSCLGTDSTADQTTPLSSPAASPPASLTHPVTFSLIYLICQSFTSKSYLGRPLTTFSWAPLYTALLTHFSLHLASKAETKFTVQHFGNCSISF